jgi:hypothetical protein
MRKDQVIAIDGEHRDWIVITTARVIGSCFRHHLVHERGVTRNNTRTGVLFIRAAAQSLPGLSNFLREFGFVIVLTGAVGQHRCGLNDIDYQRHHHQSVTYRW